MQRASTAVVVTLAFLALAVTNGLLAADCVPTSNGLLAADCVPTSNGLLAGDSLPETTAERTGQAPSAGQILWQPSKITAHEVFYATRNEAGFPLAANKGVTFELPARFRKRTLAFARLLFRKDPQDCPHEPGAWDYNGSYVRFLYKSGNKWHFWSDQFGPEKRAAARPAHKPKKSTFYDVNSQVTEVAIQNRGEGDLQKAVAYIHALTLTFLGDERLGHFTKPSRVFRHPFMLNAQSIRYAIDEKEGSPIYQGQQWDFIIPKVFRGQHLLYAVLSHRKKPSLARDIKDGIDPHPAYLQFRALDRNTRMWHWWVDRYSTAKYSEVREKDNPEDEILHNCLKCLGKIEPCRVSLTNVGYGNPNFSIANLHSLDLVFRPSLSDCRLREVIFTPQTAFTNLAQKTPVPLFGGGPRLNGRFPKALALGVRRTQRMQAIAALPNEHRFPLTKTLPSRQGRVDGLGRLHILLPTGREFVFFEVALGDLDVTSLKRNKDGYFGRSGRAELSIHFGAKRIPLVKRANIGMACLIVAAPQKTPTYIKEGDELLLTVHSDVAFVMGYRLATR